MSEPQNNPYVQRWRPAPTWLAIGLMLGPVCGAAVGIALLLPITGTSVGAAVFAGGFSGGLLGGVAGLVAGAMMTMLVGSHLAVQQARERAFLVGFCSTGLFTFPLFTILFAFHPIGIILAFLVPMAVGALSYWLATYIQRYP